MAKLIRQKDTVINSILKDIDFNKIHSVMEFLNWKWAIYGELRVPTANEIRRTLSEHLDEFFDKKLKRLSCGGFTIQRVQQDVEVTFYIEEITAFDVFKTKKKPD